MLNSCCCFRLKTGCIIIGCIDIAIRVLSLIDVWFMSGTEAQHRAVTESQPILFIKAAIHIIGLITCVFLIVGSIKKRRWMLLSWLISCGVIWLLVAIESIEVISLRGTLTLVIISAVLLVYQLYAWCVVYSLYKQVKNNSVQCVHAQI